MHFSYGMPFLLPQLILSAGGSIPSFTPTPLTSHSPSSLPPARIAHECIAPPTPHPPLSCNHPSSLHALLLNSPRELTRWQRNMAPATAQIKTPIHSCPTSCPPLRNTRISCPALRPLAKAEPAKRGCAVREQGQVPGRRATAAGGAARRAPRRRLQSLPAGPRIAQLAISGRPWSQAPRSSCSQALPAFGGRPRAVREASAAPPVRWVRAVRTPQPRQPRSAT